MSHETEPRPHWGNTDFGKGLAAALMLLALFGGAALIVWAM